MQGSPIFRMETGERFACPDSPLSFPRTIAMDENGGLEREAE